jgi:hypothetical protein
MAIHKNIATITFVATYTMFMAEAVLHYNLGIHKKTNDKKFVMPPKKDFLKLAAITGVFSILNGFVINELMKQK